MNPLRRSLLALPGLVLFPLLIVGGVAGYIFTTYALTGQTAEQPTAAATHKGRWQQDVDALTQQVLEKHINPFWVVSEGDFMAQAQELKAQAATLSDEEMLFGLMQLMGSIRDGHTRAIPDGMFEERYEESFPVEITWFDDGLFVTRVAQGAQEALGAQLVSVAGVPVKEMVTRIGPALSFDDGNPYGQRRKFERFVVRLLLLHAAGFIPDERAADFTFVKEGVNNGEPFTLTLEGQDEAEIDLVGPDFTNPPLYWQGFTDDAVVRTSYLENEDAVYLQYSDSSGLGLDFIDASTRALQLARREGVDKLIVDVRLNTGGSELPSMLFNSRLGRHSFLQNGGKLYVIMGRATFSAGFDVVSQLVNSHNAVTVGQPAGTRPNFFGNVQEFALPNSGVITTIPTTLSTNFPELGNVRVYPPDLSVPFTSEDFFAGRDPYLEAALQD